MVTAFWLDRDLDRTARWSVDSYVLSSVFKNAAVLTTAVQLNGYAEGDPTASENLSSTHADHPPERTHGSRVAAAGGVPARNIEK